MGETRAKKPSKKSLKAQQTETKGKRSLIADTIRLQPDSSEVSRQTSSSSLRSSTQPSIDKGLHSKLPLIEALSVEGRGVGLFAVQTISRGTLVLAEIPSIRITAVEEQDEVNAETIIRGKLEVLCKSERKLFNKLHDAQKAGFSQTRSIYHTNCYNLARPRSELGGSCIGLQASRINHSCVPNVQFSYLERIPPQISPLIARLDEADQAEAGAHGRGVMLFYAIKKISRGHEILSNYESVYLTSQQRQYAMQFHYGFECDCKACEPGDNPFWVKSDSRRREMIHCSAGLNRLEKMWNAKPPVVETAVEKASSHLEPTSLVARDSETVDEAVTVLQRLVELLEAEGLTGVDLTKAYHKLTRWCRRRSEADDAQLMRWTRLEQDAVVEVFGPYSPRIHNRSNHERGTKS